MSSSHLSELRYCLCARDQPTWHVGRWQRSCAGCAGTGGGASWGRWRPSDARQVGRRVRREGRLCLVTLLALAARHTWRAHARTQGALCTCGQVIDGPWQVLKTQTERGGQESTNMVYEALVHFDNFINRLNHNFYSFAMFYSYTGCSISMSQFPLCGSDMSGTHTNTLHAHTHTHTHRRPRGLCPYLSFSEEKKWVCISAGGCHGYQGL